MKNARPIKGELAAADQGAVIFTCGELPGRKSTATSEVLARLLNYERLTGMEAVLGVSSTRLAAIVEYLERRYRWVISRENKVTGCSDGRVATIKEYFFLPEVIESAVAKGAAGWRMEVQAARRTLRAKAAEAKRTAERVNANRRRVHQCTGQFGLFEGVGA